MHEPEMELVCDLIHQVLESRGDAEITSQVRKQVQDLCDAFPLYRRSYHT